MIGAMPSAFIMAACQIIHDNSAFLLRAHPGTQYWSDQLWCARAEISSWK
jgi:hypothetical protein